MQHGVSTSFSKTAVTPAVQVPSAIPFIVGTAPINMGNMNNVNKPVLLYSLKEAAQELGYFKNFKSGFTSNEVIYSQFQLFGKSPVVFVNVLDPVKHKTAVAEKSITFDNGRAVVDDFGVIKSSVVIMKDTTELTVDKDYKLSFNDNGTLMIEVISAGLLDKIATTNISYSKLDPSKVTTDDIIGGVNAETGDKTGLQLLNSVYSKFNIAPTLIAAPGYSHSSAVSVAISKISEQYNSLFRAVAVVDILDSSIKKYSDVISFKKENSLNNGNTIYCFPKVKIADDELYLSTLTLGLIASTDEANQGVPFKSPSNEYLPVTSLVNNDADIFLELNEANYLNENGVFTALNFIGGFKSWGNRTGCYPSELDVRFNMINNVRMFNAISNELIVTYWSRIDGAVTKRFIDNIVISMQARLDALVGIGAIVGGRIEFREEDNASINTMNGMVKFKIFLTPPAAAESIEFDLEYDVEYLKEIFN